MKTNNKGGRPTANATRVPMVSLMVRLPQETVDALDTLAALEGVNRQDEIRIAVSDRLRKMARKTAGK